MAGSRRTGQDHRTQCRRAGAARQRDDDDKYRDDRRYGSRPYKKKSLLGELFDF